MAGTALTVAVAATDLEKQRGLMGVDDLGDLSGMLFVWDRPVSWSFWMKDTPMPLDLLGFSEDLTVIWRQSMTTCNTDPCELYEPPVPFLWILETPRDLLPRVQMGDPLVPVSIGP